MKKINAVFIENTSLKYIFIFFGLVFASITFVNHYNFRTYGWDLGINNNAIFDYAHFRWNDCMIMQPAFTNVLSDHFSLYPIFFSPLYWLFGSWTMLIVQFASILFGGLGIYIYVRKLTHNTVVSAIALAHFFSIWGIYSALSFDYHDNVVAAMFLPWLLYFFEKKNWKVTALFFAFILVAKENMALWAIFIGLGIAVHYAIKKEYKNALIGLLFSLIAAIYFISVIKIIIPSLATPGRDYLHYTYHALGDNFGQALVTMFKRPLYVLELLFSNHTGQVEADGIKLEFYTALMLAGGVSFLFYPEFFIMAVPIIAQKVFNDLFIRWGINDHYSIEFAPVLTVSVFTLIHRLKQRKVMFSYLFFFISLISTIKFLDQRKSKWYKSENNRFYQKAHWVRNFNVNEVYQALELIPMHAKVSAQSQLAPHLAFRDFIYHFPHIADADYIALLTADENKYPLDEKSYQNKIQDLIDSKQWVIYEKKDAVLILKRIK